MKPFNIKGKGRHYPHPIHGEAKPLPSVTNILGAYPKQLFLTPWAAKKQNELACEKSAEVYEWAVARRITDGKQFARELEAHIGKERKHKTEFERAGEIGTKVHGAIEFFIKNQMGLPCEEPETLEGEAMHSYMAFDDFWFQARPRPLYSELFVWNDTDEHAGTTDLVAEIEITKDLVSRINSRFKDPRVAGFIGQTVRADIDFKTSTGIYADTMLQLAAYLDSLEKMSILGNEAWGMVVRLPKDGEKWEVAFLHPDDRAKKYEAFMAVKRVWEDMHGA